MKFHPDNNDPDYDIKTDNVPYRGTVPHLPDVQDTATWPARTKTTTDVTKDTQVQDLPSYGTPVERPTFTEPIPVTVLELPSIDEFKVTEFYSTSISETQAQRILGRDKTRTRARITNISGTGSNAVFIGHRPDITANAVGTVYKLTVGQDITVYGQNEIYAIGIDDTVAALSIVVDRVERT